MSPELLRGWYVILLRPAATRGPLLRAVRRQCAEPVALPSLRLQALNDEETMQALRRALDTETVIASSPAAVRFARNLPAWRIAMPKRAFAVGQGTAAALHNAGVSEVITPSREDSEGLLGLPELSGKNITRIGLLTAPGGRDLIEPELKRRGIQVHRVDLYRRRPARLDQRHFERLRQAGRPLALLHSSAEALDTLLAAVPADVRAILGEAIVVPSSPRLAEQAARHGLHCCAPAGSASPQALLSALHHHAVETGIR